MRALDLFCGGGGAALGMIAAGFEVVGVDTDPRCGKVYPGHFIVGNALRPPVRLEDFDFIWASPPCQAFSLAARGGNRDRHDDLIPATRALLESSGTAWCIENVPQAPLKRRLVLNGPVVGLPRIERRRVFETSFFCFQPPLPKRTTQAVSIRRKNNGSVRGRGGKITPYVPLPEARVMMGVDTPMTMSQLGNSVPPPMAEWIARRVPRRNVGF